jgi:hypothetical protein
MKGRRILIGVLALGLLLALAVGLSQAQEPEPPEVVEGAEREASVAAIVGDGIPIQGRLTDAGGNPVPDGDYTMTFRLYDVSSAGEPLCEDTDGPPGNPLDPAVPVTNGLFTAYMNGCTADVINGQRLYLGVKVGSDEEMTPRRGIYAVPYAWSLRPGAIISGAVTSDAIVHAENSATSGRALRGYATAASGTNYGVVGRSWSPDGYGGYFANDGGGYALGVKGGMKMTVNATGATPINVGDRYRDNAIIAWANVNSDGTIAWDFGVTQVLRESSGTYLIEIDADTTGTSSFIPIAIAEVNTAPDSAADARIVSIQQVNQSIFRVFITNGDWHMEDNQFVFMVTGR